jgi:hypothetical protein
VVEQESRHCVFLRRVGFFCAPADCLREAIAMEGTLGMRDGVEAFPRTDVPPARAAVFAVLPGQRQRLLAAGSRRGDYIVPAQFLQEAA